MVAGRVSFGRPFVWLLLVAVQDRRNSAHRRISITAKDISKLAKKMIRVGAELGKLKWEINKLYEKAPRRDWNNNFSTAICSGWLILGRTVAGLPSVGTGLADIDRAFHEIPGPRSLRPRLVGCVGSAASTCCASTPPDAASASRARTS